MEINSEDIKRLLKNEVSPNVDIDNLADDDSWDKAGIDSLDRSSFFLALEEETGVEIPDKDLDKLDSVAKLIEYFKQK